MQFYQNFYNQWHFCSQILHTHVLNKDTHADHFWCLISKYTEYDNIFINKSLEFCNKNFQMCVWNLAAKVPLVIEILVKLHRG